MFGDCRGGVTTMSCAAGPRPARIEGKHGAELNLAVQSRRRAAHRAGHECRTRILPMMAFVHASSATQRRPSRYQAVSIYAPDAATR